MRILHVLDHSIPLHSGYTFRTRAILEQQRALGWETAHLTSPKHGLGTAAQGGHPAKVGTLDVCTMEEVVDGLHFYRTPPPEGIDARLPALGQLALVRGLTARLKDVAMKVMPDIIHAHSPALNGIAALRVANRQRIPLVYECRAFWEDAAVDHGTSKEWGMRYRLTRAMETAVFQRADAVTTICEGLRNEMVGRGIPSGKISVVPNAVDLTRFAMGRQTDSALAAGLGLSGKTVLGFIGSFYAYEGLPLLLQALPGMLERAPDVRVLLVGGGPQEVELKNLVDQLDLVGKVVFTGRVPHEQVARYYDLVDIFVYPRLSMRLTELVTPLKPLEAMAQGKLVVASDVGGHRELIRDGKTGRLFQAGSSSALSGEVLDLVSHKERWSALHKAARRFVERERNWPVSVGRYSAIYEGLVERGERGKPRAAAAGGS